MYIKNKKLIYVFNKTLALQMKIVLRFSWSFAFFIGLYFNKTFKMCSIIFYQPFLHLLVEGLNVVIYPSLFNISKHSFCFRTQHIKHNHTFYGGTLIINAPSKTYYDFVATPTSNYRIYHEENGELLVILGHGMFCELGCTMV
jgi:hypothetical protein